MKHLVFISALLVILISCKKEFSKDSNNKLQLVSFLQLCLKDSILEKDYAQLDFENTVITNYNWGIKTVRIPFKTFEPGENFVALKMSINGAIEAAKIIEIKSVRTTGKAIKGNVNLYNGDIAIYSLKRKKVIHSIIENGFIKSFHSFNSISLLQKSVVPVIAPSIDLPEVILISNVVGGGDSYSWSTWANLLSILNVGTSGGGAGGIGNGTGSPGSYYENIGLTGNTGSVSGSTGNLSGAILVDYEIGNTNPAIDISKYIKCFQNIPDAGSVCSIEILTDIPVDTNPNAFFDWENESPGHTFLKITKSNGSQSVTQHIGFYPESNWKTMLTPAPIKGKFVDNATHEFNASLKMNITPAELQKALTQMSYLARFVNYDIDEYNCTDWALDVFNKARSSSIQLAIPLYQIPGGQAPYGTSTPQGLYKVLKSMKNMGGPESNKILVSNQKRFAGQSLGPCN